MRTVTAALLLVLAASCTAPPLTLALLTAAAATARPLRV